MEPDRQVIFVPTPKCLNVFIPWNVPPEVAAQLVLERLWGQAHTDDETEPDQE